MKHVAEGSLDLDRFQYRRKIALAALLGVMFFFLLSCAHSKQARTVCMNMSRNSA